MKIKKSSSLFLCFLLICLYTAKCNAQWFIGTKIGGSYNAMYSPNAKGYTYNLGKWGYTAGFFGEYHFLETVALQVAFSWTQKNYSNIHSRKYYTDYMNDYIELSSLFKYYLFGQDQLKIFTTLGGYISYWTSIHQKGNTFNPLDNRNYFHFSENCSFNDKKNQRFEIGILGGMGLNYEINPRHHALAEFRYIFSLTDMEKPYLHKSAKKNNTMLLSLGYKYEL